MRNDTRCPHPGIAAGKIGGSWNHRETYVVPEIILQVDAEEPYSRTQNQTQTNNVDYSAMIPEYRFGLQYVGWQLCKVASISRKQSAIILHYKFLWKVLQFRWLLCLKWDVVKTLLYLAINISMKLCFIPYYRPWEAYFWIILVYRAIIITNGCVNFLYDSMSHRNKKKKMTIKSLNQIQAQSY